jgi:hypothetical protein
MASKTTARSGTDRPRHDALVALRHVLKAEHSGDRRLQRSGLFLEDLVPEIAWNLGSVDEDRFAKVVRWIGDREGPDSLGVGSVVGLGVLVDRLLRNEPHVEPGSWIDTNQQNASRRRAVDDHDFVEPDTTRLCDRAA